MPIPAVYRLEKRNDLIIDIHTHAFPDALAEKTIPVMAEGAGVPAHTDGTLGGLTAALTRAGVNIGVLQQVATRPGQSRRINEWTVSVLSDTIQAFGSIHPDDPDIPGVIAYLKEHGIRGVKLHPDYQQFMADEPRAFSLYESLFREDMAVLFHAGIDLELSDPVHCTPAMLANVIGEFPKATIIAAHFGGYQCWDDVEEHLIGTPICLDTAYTLPELPPRRMVDMARRHGIDRVLFGTDSPWRDIAGEVGAVSRAGFSPAELDKVLWINAARILDLPIT